MLLSGGAIFGVVDHLWNGELFLLSGNLATDLMLGVVITVAIVAAWSLLVWLDRPSEAGQPVSG